MDDLRYLRFGYVPDDPPRLCDTFVSHALESIPADEFLPKRWRHGGDPIRFQIKYGNHRVMWAMSYSSCTLLINGFYIMRIWTNVSKTCTVDIHADLCVPGAEMIPDSCARKCKPLYLRIRPQTEDEFRQLMDRVKVTYGA